MATIGAFDAETHFLALLERVEKGEEITITRRGKPVAALTRVKGGERTRDRAEVIHKLQEFGRGRSRGGMTIRRLIEEGRRY